MYILQITDVDILEVETAMNEAFTELVVKLSEASFRPIFIKVRSIIYSLLNNININTLQHNLY